MKLQFKLALYNSLTKVAVLTLMGGMMLLSIDKLSEHHIQQRLLHKKIKLIQNLSGLEISDLLAQQSTFTDYNLLKEEYIILKVAKGQTDTSKNHFSSELREIEGSQEEYQILNTSFSYRGKTYVLELGEAMSAIGQLRHTIIAFTFFFLLAAVGMSLIADLAFTKFLLRPFYRIVDQKLNRVNDPIHFSYAPMKTTTADFRMLDESISTLMAKISSLFLSEKAFIANVSHELLTPISILNSRLENLLNEESLSPDGENKIFACLKTLGMLKAIINSLLLISKVENQQFDKPDEISINKAVVDVCDELEHRLMMMNLHFEISIKQNFSFQGNKSLFHILLMNLVNNAIKYNTPSGKICIYDGIDNEGYQLLSIQDTGQGMSAEEQVKAFNRFEKFQSEKADSHGLGLSIVKTIADFHGIRVSIRSEKGSGTTVELVFQKD